MTHLAIILVGVLASPLTRIGGEPGFKQHIDALEQSFLTAPNANEAYRIAVGYASRGSIDGTKKWLSQAKGLGLDRDRIELCLAEAFFHHGDYEGAIRSYFEVVHRLPNHFGALLGLWKSRLKASASSSSIDRAKVDGVLEDSGFPVVSLETPPKPKAGNRLVYEAKRALRTGRIQEAEEMLREAIRQHWLAPDPYRLLSTLWRLHGDARKQHGAISIYLEFATKPDQLYRRALRTWMDTERRGKLRQ